MNITEDHWLETAKRDEITGGSPMAIRRCVVVHFTSGATAKSSIESMRGAGLSAHIVVDRDGTIYQCRPFNKQCAHAGKSRWRDPKTGVLYSGLNSCSIGIEIANTGNDDGVIKWAVKNAGATVISAKHRNGGKVQNWEEYPKAQLEAVFAVVAAVVKKYSLDDITGHDCIAPERKDDPGPAFPMQQLRDANGFAGLPAVHKP
jgi:N-acetylmuramoyl-L-alanine amidase